MAEPVTPTRELGLSTERKIEILSERNLYVLIAEDSEDDCLFIKQAMIRAASRLVVVGEARDGEGVMAYLAGSGRYADRRQYPFPDLLLLDWNMPRKSGLELLEWLRLQNFPALHVAVVSGAMTEQEEQQAAAYGIRHFFTKASQLSEYTKIVKAIEARVTC